MLKKIRFFLALVFWVSITLLFLDFTGTLLLFLSWMAKIQFLPAILSLNIGAIIFVIALTLLFGRIYCSVICPMGVFQDFVSRIAGKFKKRRFKFTSEKRKTRLIILGVFVVLMLLFSPLAILIAPYSAYGRMVNSLLQPLYILLNNLAAKIAEHYDSYAFYSVDVWVKSGVTLIVSIVTFLVVTIWSWKSGRGYCNTVCPVGTVLGLLSTKAVFKINIDKDKCVNCSLCEKNCKAQAIDFKAHTVDYSRCVACMNCIDVCKKDAIKFSKNSAKESKENNNEKVDSTFRKTISTTALLAVTGALQAQEKQFDGGFAVIEDKKIPIGNVP